MTTPQQAALLAFQARLNANTLTPADQGLLNDALHDLIPIWGFGGTGAPPDQQTDAGQTFETPGSEWYAVLFAIAEGAGGGGGAMTGPTFVLRPGGVAGGNVYTNWATFYAALSSIDGPKFILADDSIAPIVVPTAGMPVNGWNLDNTTWNANALSPTFTMSFADGAKIDPSSGNTTIYVNYVNWVSESASPVVTINNASDFFIIHLFGTGCILQSDVGKAPFFAVTNGTLIGNVLLGASLGNGTDAMLTSTAPGSAIFFIAELASINANAFTGAGTVRTNLASGASVSLTQAAPLDREGNSSLVASGELTIIGNATPTMLPVINTWVVVAGTYTNDLTPQSFTLNLGAGTMSPNPNGRYWTNVSINISPTSTSTFEFGVFKNGVLIPDHVAFPINLASRPQSVTITGIDDIAGGDVLDVRVRCTDAALEQMLVTAMNFAIG